MSSPNTTSTASVVNQLSVNAKALPTVAGKPIVFTVVSTIKITRVTVDGSRTTTSVETYVVPTTGTVIITGVNPLPFKAEAGGSIVLGALMVVWVINKNLWRWSRQ